MSLVWFVRPGLKSVISGEAAASGSRGPRGDIKSVDIRVYPNVTGTEQIGDDIFGLAWLLSRRGLPHLMILTLL